LCWKDFAIMPEYDAQLLLNTGTVTAWDVVCPGLCRGKTGEEWAPATRLVFPYRGMYVHYAGSNEHVGDPNQLVFINEHESYRASHPVGGGDATLTVAVDPATLLELTPRDYRHSRERAAFNRSGLRVDARSQLLAAQLRQRMKLRSIGRLEAETLALELVRHSLSDTEFRSTAINSGRAKKIADEAKSLLCSAPARRWTLAELAGNVRVSPMYLTDSFRRAEGIPLYRYHLRLRLARALTLLAETDDLTVLALDLGFTSHSHFSAAFRRTFGQTPSDFQKAIGDRATSIPDDDHLVQQYFDSQRVYLSRNVFAGPA
jgi:AraC-like DNA-binding protein